jgi:hypothetical protein
VNEAFIHICQHHGLDNIKDVMSFEESDVKVIYPNPNDLPLALSTALVKKILFLQSWYGDQL